MHLPSFLPPPQLAPGPHSPSPGWFRTDVSPGALSIFSSRYSALAIDVRTYNYYNKIYCGDALQKLWYCVVVSCKVLKMIFTCEPVCLCTKCSPPSLPQHASSAFLGGEAPLTLLRGKELEKRRREGVEGGAQNPKSGERTKPHFPLLDRDANKAFPLGAFLPLTCAKTPESSRRFIEEAESDEMRQFPLSLLNMSKLALSAFSYFLILFICHQEAAWKEKDAFPILIGAFFSARMKRTGLWLAKHMFFFVIVNDVSQEKIIKKNTRRMRH